MKHLNMRAILSITLVSLALIAVTCLTFPALSTQLIKSIVAAWYFVLGLWQMLPPIIQKLPAIAALFIIGMRLHSEEYGHELHKDGHQGIMQRFVRSYLQPKARHLVRLDRLKVLVGATFWLTAVTWGILPELTTVPKELLQVVILVFGFTCAKLVFESACGMFTRLAGSDHERLMPGQPHVLLEWTEIPGGKVMLRPIKCIVVERGIFLVAFEPIEEADKQSLFQPFINRPYSQLLLGDRKYFLPKRAKQVQSDSQKNGTNQQSDDDNGMLVQAADVPSDEPPSSPAGATPAVEPQAPVSESAPPEQAKPQSAPDSAPKAKTRSVLSTMKQSDVAESSSNQQNDDLLHTIMDADIDALKSMEPLSNMDTAVVMRRDHTHKHVHSDCLELRSMNESDIRTICAQDMQNFCPIPAVVVNPASCAGSCAESKPKAKRNLDKEARTMEVDLSDGLDPSEMVIAVDEEEEGGETHHFK